ncbi:MAG: methyltransferase domain-containing protein [Burkholderiaceae bacterium]|nr:MAG: methyltransferase domain-containing protein [Burkholderiaceae bacterium]
MINSNDPNLPLIESARLHIEEGRLPEAAAVLNQARAQIPTDPRVYIMAALMTEKTGNVAAAFGLMEQGLTLAPEWAPGIMELAHMQARQGQFPEARENAATAFDLEGGNPLVRGGAIQVALLCGDRNLAVRHLREGLAQIPDHESWRKLLASTLNQLGQTDEALALWDGLVADSPSDRKALEGRMHTLLMAGRLADAARDTTALLALDPQNAIYAYYNARAHGETPAHQPAELNRHLFDSAAAVFDQQLVQALRYKLPQQIAQQILASYPARQCNLLDLGCGTGLLGAHLGKLKGRMVGADLSPKMLELAERRGVYDSLKTADLQDTLNESQAASYDVVVALEVCVYVGELSAMIAGAWRVLVPGGRLIFSCESGTPGGPDLYLNPATERYTHQRNHVEQQSRAAGFTVQTEETVLRQERGKPVSGFVITAVKPA